MNTLINSAEIHNLLLNAEARVDYFSSLSEEQIEDIASILWERAGINYFQVLQMRADKALRWSQRINKENQEAMRKT